jgi:outer membrane protein OmpA-like peptidoglycan-associated protein
MRALIASLVAIAMLAGPCMVRAECGNAFAPPEPVDPGNALTLYQDGMAAMRGDRMVDADHLMRSSFARLSDAPVDAAAALEPMVLARLVEVAVQRKDLVAGMYRMKVLRERLALRPSHPAWVDAVIRMADEATIAQQNAVAGSDEAGACRSLGVAVRSAARIGFATDSATIDDAARADLAHIARNLAASGAARVIVRGHTDARGSDSYNDALSLRRAAAVVTMLTVIEPDLAGKLVAQGAGKREPLYPGDDEDSYRLNRRVEFAPVKSP